MSYEGPERRANPVWRTVKQFVREFGNEPEGRLHHLWRDVVPLLAIVIAAWAVLGVESKVDQAAVDAGVARAEATSAKRVAASQRAGRRTAVGITCGATSAIIAAGRATITGGGDLPDVFERNLRRLGYPPRRQREAAAREAADAYSRSIAKAIEKESGMTDIVLADGSLDCDRVKVAARAQP